VGEEEMDLLLRQKQRRLMTTEELKKLRPWTWLVFDGSDSGKKYDDKFGVYYALLYYGLSEEFGCVLFPIVLDMTDQGQTLLTSIKGEGEMKIKSYSPGTYDVWDENDYQGYFKDGLRVAMKSEVKHIKDFLSGIGVKVDPPKTTVRVPWEIDDDEFLDCSPLLEKLN
jgi:hypothetical protein